MLVRIAFGHADDCSPDAIYHYGGVLKRTRELEQFRDSGALVHARLQVCGLRWTAMFEWDPLLFVITIFEPLAPTVALCVSVLRAACPAC